MDVCEPKSREKPHIHDVFVFFEKSRHAAVMSKLSPSFGLSITEDLVHFDKPQEAVSDKEEGRPQNLLTFIHALAAD